RRPGRAAVGLVAADARTPLGARAKAVTGAFVQAGRRVADGAFGRRFVAAVGVGKRVGGNGGSHGRGGGGFRLGGADCWRCGFGASSGGGRRRGKGDGNHE